MAEDKRIRVSADASPLQELRQNVQSLWNDFMKMEGGFKELAESTLEVIREQINLIEERNRLESGTSSVYQPLPPHTLETPSIDPKKDIYDYNKNVGRELGEPKLDRELSLIGRDERLSNSESLVSIENILERTLEEILVISGTLEKGQRDKINRVTKPDIDDIDVPPGAEPPKPPMSRDDDSADGISGGKMGGFRLPTSMGALMGMLPFGAALLGIGQMFGQQAQFQTRQFGAQNEFQRLNNEGNHWLLNMLSFGITGAKSQEKEIGRAFAFQNDQALKDYSALHGVSWETSLKRQVTNTFEEKDIDYLNAVLEQRQPGGGGVTKRGQWWYDLMNGIFTSKTNRGDENSEWKRINEGLKDEQAEVKRRRQLIEESEKGDNPNITRKEFHNWASQTLGLNITDYLNRVVGLQRSGVKAENTDINTLNQLMMAERLRGVSQQESSSLLAATRYDNSGFGGARVLQAFDKNLQNQGYDNQYIAATLGEHLSQFNRSVERLIGKTGSINTEEIVRSMTTVQKVTGMEGRQLERVQAAISGQDVSQDEVTQALLMRTVQQMYGGKLSFPEMMSKIEQISNDTKFQAEFIGMIRKLTGGDDTQEANLLKAIFPNLSWTDIVAIVGKPIEEIQKHLEQKTKVETEEYSEEASRATIGAEELSNAGTRTFQTMDGINQRLNQQGTNLKEVLESLEKPIKVTIVKGSGQPTENSAELEEYIKMIEKMYNISMNPALGKEIGRGMALGLRDAGLTFELE